MKTTPQLTLMIEKLRDVCRGDGEAPESIAALLWLMVASEDCRRTLEASTPTGEDLERLCERLGHPVRAWVQFSPQACDLLSRPPSPAGLPEMATAGGGSG